MKTLSHPRDNRLLAALPDVEWRRWLPHLEPADMALSHAYFPTTAIVSMLYVMQDGDSAEIAVIGNEGVVGISLFMGGGSTPSRAVVQNAGQGFRMKAQTLKADFEQSLPVSHLLLRYTQALITQMSQTAVNRPVF